MKRGRIIEARDFMTALREAREAGATAIQPPLSCEVRPLDEYIAELESGGEGPGEACILSTPGRNGRMTRRFTCCIGCDWLHGQRVEERRIA